LKWGKFGSFYACSAYDKKKPVAVATTPWKKDPKKVVKRIEGKLKYPMLVKPVEAGDAPAQTEVKNTKELKAAIDALADSQAKVTVEQVSCSFTKENFASKPDLISPEAQEATSDSEEYCEQCGRVMVLKRGRFGMFMACPGYNEDPPCKTIRKLSQKQQQKPPVPLDENCPKCGKPLVLRNGQYGEFVSCSGYPDCKYVKQNLVEGMKCPKCGEGDLAERRSRFGNTFYGCTNYPKCDFTANAKPVPKQCPECGSSYLLEKTLKSGVYLICPNNKTHERPRKGKKKAPESEPTVVCHYEKRIGDAAEKKVETPQEEPQPVA
jgi:DNA topoisomerase-1